MNRSSLTVMFAIALAIGSSVTRISAGAPSSASGSAKCKKPCSAKPTTQNIVVKERTPVAKSTKRGCCSKKKSTNGDALAASDRGVEPTKAMKKSTNKDATHRSSNEPKKPAGDFFELTSLAKSLDPLRDHFNANKDKLRFVTLLSPT